MKPGGRHRTEDMFQSRGTEMHSNTVQKSGEMKCFFL